MAHGGHDMGMTGMTGMPEMNGTTHGPGMPGMHMMKMYFNTDWQHSYVLFEEWMLMKEWQLAVACVVIAIIAALYEGLKVFREYLLMKYGVHNQYEVSSEASGDFKGDVGISQPSANTVRARMCSWLHFLQSFLHMVQVAVSYILMLIVMTFNVWLCISVVLGAGIGYFLFGWKRAVIMDSNEHCH